MIVKLEILRDVKFGGKKHKKVPSSTSRTRTKSEFSSLADPRRRSRKRKSPRRQSLPKNRNRPNPRRLRLTQKRVSDASEYWRSAPAVGSQTSRVHFGHRPGHGPRPRLLEGEIAIIADVANVSGTTPTADLKIQDSADNSSFADIVPAASFTQVTTVAGRQKMSLNKNELRRYIRVVYTLGGTSPVYLISVNAVGMKRYADGA
jgi:hypothetical protein